MNNVSPKLVENSYFFSGNSNPRFDNELVKHLPSHSSNIAWWNPNNSHPLHCTLGFFFSPNQQQPTFNTVKSLAESQIKQIPHSLHLKVEDCQITPGGWAILTFKENKKLKRLHNQFVEAMEQQGGLKPSKFSGNQYMAHVSIGKLKPGANPTQALQELQKVCQVIQQNPFPFVVFDLHLTKVENQQNVEVTEQTLKRRDVGIQKVTPSGNCKIIEFNQLTSAQNFAKKLNKHYGFESHQSPGMFKQVKSKGNLHTLLLSQAEFDKVNGHFNNLR